jgi:hypothetical protein
MQVDERYGTRNEGEVMNREEMRAILEARRVPKEWNGVCESDPIADIQEAIKKSAMVPGLADVVSRTYPWCKENTYATYQSAAVATSDLLNYLYPKVSDCLYLALHDGNGEIHYRGSRRVCMPRNAEVWKVEGNTASNRLRIDFLPAYDEDFLVTHVGIWSELTGGQELYSVALDYALHLCGTCEECYFKPGGLVITGSG